MKKTTVYAIFSKDVKAKDKYKVTSPPKIFFKTRKEAHQYGKKKYGNDYKVMVY